MPPSNSLLSFVSNTPHTNGSKSPGFSSTCSQSSKWRAAAAAAAAVTITHLAQRTCTLELLLGNSLVFLQRNPLWEKDHPWLAFLTRHTKSGATTRALATWWGWIMWDNCNSLANKSCTAFHRGLLNIRKTTMNVHKWLRENWKTEKVENKFIDRKNTWKIKKETRVMLRARSVSQSPSPLSLAEQRAAAS